MGRRNKRAMAKTEDQISAYFRVHMIDGKAGSRTHWYKFDIAEEEDGFYNNIDSPTELSPFSKTYQPGDSACIGVNSMLYSLGGLSRHDKPSKLVYRYNTIHPEEGWVRAPKMSLGRRSPQVVAVKGKIFVMGGLGYTSYPGNDNEDYFVTKWAEFYDPEITDGSWEPVEVIEFNDSVLEKPQPLASLLSFGYSSRNQYKHVYSPDFLLGKLGSHEIFICPDGGSSYIYHVTKKSLTTVVTNKLFDNLELSPSPPLFIGTTVYAFNRVRSSRVEAFNILGGRKLMGKGSPCLLTESQMRECDFPITFRTDGLSCHDGSPNRHLHFLGPDYDVPSKSGDLIYKFTTVIPETDMLKRSPKYSYFSIPSDPCDLVSNGILLDVKLEKTKRLRGN